MEQAQADIGSLHQDITRSQSVHIVEQKDVGECQKGISEATKKQGNEILLLIQGPISFFFFIISHFPTELELLIKHLIHFRDIHVL